ncbi:MAG: YfhO family protein [Candidatus Dormibacteria bacterium]
MADPRQSSGAASTRRWDTLRQVVARTLWSPGFRRGATSVLIVVVVQASVLAVTYRAVVLHGRSLMTAIYVTGTEGQALAYGYPGPPILGSNEIDPGASAWGYEPQIAKAHQELSTGELPLWDSNVMLGAPLAADAVAGLYNPLTWPLVASPTPTTWDVWLLLRLLAAGLLCSLLAGYLRLSLVPSIVAGSIFMLSGVFVERTSTIQTGIMATLPLIILGAEACIRRPSRWSSGVLALAIASSVLFGMPEETFMCVLLGAVYFAVRFGALCLRRDRASCVRAAYAGAGGAAIGMLLSLPLIVPFEEYIGAGYTGFVGTHNSLLLENAKELLSLIGPHWNVVGPHHFSGSTEPIDNWFGVGASVLALIGLGAGTLPRSTRAVLALSAVAIEAATIGFPSWYLQLVADTPVLGNIFIWAYGGVIVSLGVAILAGHGLQRILLRKVGARGVVIAAAVVVALIGAGAPSYLSGTPIRWDQVAVTGVTLLVVTGGGVIACRAGGWPRLAGLALVWAAVTGELIFLASPEFALPLAYNPFTSTPTTEYLQQVDPSGTGRTYSATGILYPTTNQAFDLDDIRNLDPIYIDRTYEYLKLFVVPGLSDRFDGEGTNVAEVNDNPFFDALNVKYVLVGPPQAQNATDLLWDQYRLVTVAADGVGIYENLDAAPRAQVVFSTTRAGSEPDAIATMSQPGFDPLTQAVVETSPSAAIPSHQSAPVPATMELYRDDEVIMKTTTTQPGVLVLADAYYPGWVAEVDGKPAPIYATDLALRGVVVPAGTHTIVMRYEPSSVVIGALGVPAGVALWAIGGWGVPAGLYLLRRRRRKPNQATAAGDGAPADQPRV